MSQQAIREQMEAQIRETIEPILASNRRKAAMREELLAHLIGAYEQELDAGAGPRAAFNTASTRFGNLLTIRKELTQSVPPAERLMYLLLSLREPLMLRWILIGTACVAVGMAVILPALAQIKEGRHFTMQGAVCLSAGVALVVAGLGTIGVKIARR